ncbi:hypothetical protein BO82DRAFT_47508 [Aspergillus uvarum CBS 121591]|uniref:Uncharacterized protein n=1 Tax=Aspergillus uvarum CBS 121591 TaxID=1448315 RepID=A0A319D5K7_9EURO|nr:hypothetical protein BO82DRAFT_47508 [Aspergillus uvarum CBS 121591]PYH83198.1 hypothetical protein BO82DRAFT_47508 [Aspergillus uvarum CBS 121591]
MRQKIGYDGRFVPDGGRLYPANCSVGTGFLLSSLQQWSMLVSHSDRNQIKCVGGGGGVDKLVILDLPSVQYIKSWIERSFTHPSFGLSIDTGIDISKSIISSVLTQFLLLDSNADFNYIVNIRYKQCIPQPTHPHLLTYSPHSQDPPQQNINTHNLDHHTMQQGSAQHTPTTRMNNISAQKSEIRLHASNLNHGERVWTLDSHLFPTGRGLDSGGHERTDGPSRVQTSRPFFIHCQTVGIGMLIGSQIDNSHDNLFSKA